MRKRVHPVLRRIGIAFVIALLVFLTAPRFSSAQQQALTMAVGGFAASMDYQIACDMLTWSALKMVVDPLLYRDENNAIKPWLATAWKRMGPMTWRFTLRKGVEFSDGEPFNAAAVKFTLDRYHNPRACLRPTFDNIASVNVVDDYTADVITKTPDWTIPYLLSTWGEMLPPKAAADMNTYGAHPVGTGPYVVDSWTPGDRLVLRRNDHYWAPQPPYQRITWRILSDDGTRVGALKSGEIDYANNIPPDEVADLKKATGLKVLSVPSIRIVSISMNMAKKTPFSQDVKVRQAIWYGINRRAIVDSLLSGLGDPAVDYIVAPGIEYAIRFPELFKYDPAKAKALLAEAGYATGVTGCNFGAPVGRYITDKEVGTALVGQLARIGIHCSLTQQPIGPFLSAFREGQDSPFGLGFLSMAPQDTEMNFGLGILWANSPYTQYSDPAAYRLWVQARESQNDGQRRSLYAQLQKVYAQSAVSIPIYRQPVIDGVKAGIPYKIRADEQVLLEGRYAVSK